MAEIKAIETQYKGYRFRSRLEARWAVWFEALGVQWEYEPEGYQLPSGWYLPDFRIEGAFWFEVKGKIPGPDECRLANDLCEITKMPVMVLGQIPQDEADDNCVLGSWGVFENEDKCARQIPIEKPHDAIKRMMFGNDANWNCEWGPQLACPICSSEYVHASGTETGEWSGRNGCIRLSMWCENGHSWVVRFGEHKGGQWIDVEDCQAIVYPPFTLAKSQGDIQRACVAARSARFEHGEMPQ